jgi:MFS family permease
MTVSSDVNPAIGRGAETPGTPITDARLDSSQTIQPLTAGYRRYALGMLLIIYTLNFLDRQIVNIIAEPIKLDLGLKDWQLGMMSGLAFAVFYTVLGIPIARYAEKANRPAIIASAVFIWSGFTVLCGFVQNFWQLVLARIGVGVGEAGCTPPAHSLITDYVPKDKRASAIAFYSIGTPLGSLIGTALGGLVADAYGWRTAFMIAGAPGVIIAILTFVSLPEPRKKLQADLRARANAAQPSLRAAFAVLRSKRTFWLIAFAAAMKALIGYGHAPFTASFFLRVHGDKLELHAAQLSSFLNGVFGTEIALGRLGFLSLALSVVAGIAGVLGTWIGGAVADRYGAKDLRAYVVIPGVASLVTIPLYVWALMTDSIPLAIPLLAVVAMVGSLWYGPVYATAQSLVPPQMRATTAAVLLFIINLIGLGLGPLAVGVMSDAFANGLGLGVAEGLRWAMIVAMFLNVFAFLFFWLARKTIREECVS